MFVSVKPCAHKKHIITGILVFMCSLFVLPFICPCIDLNDPAKPQPLYINATVEFDTWYGGTYRFDCNREIQIPQNELSDFYSKPGDTAPVEYHPLFPQFAHIAGLR